MQLIFPGLHAYHHVKEDTVVIDALRKDAKEMRGDLIRRVEEYYVVMEKEMETRRMRGETKIAMIY